MLIAHEQPHTHTLLFALGASVLLHVAMAVVSIRVPASFVVSSALPDSTHNATLVNLGESQPSPIKVTWLGSTEETEHEAPKASSSQMDQQIGGDSAEAPATPQQPTDSQESPTNPSILRFAIRTEAIERELAYAAETVASVAQQIATSLASELAAMQRAVELDQRAQADYAEAQKRAERSESLEHSNAQPKPAATTGANQGSGTSDRESDATSENVPLRWKPGQPLSAEGVRIATHKPKFTHTTLVSTRPANPIVEITFGKSGSVARNGVRFTGRGTGYPEVDQPLIEALYLWTASGRKVDDLGLNQTLSIKILIVLN